MIKEILAAEAARLRARPPWVRGMVAVALLSLVYLLGEELLHFISSSSFSSCPDCSR